jgi:hypothetical protein
MSQKDLEAVRAELMELPSEAVVEPWGPAAVVLQEANDLWTYVRQDSVSQRLLAVGLAAGTIERLGIAVGAARAALAVDGHARSQQERGAKGARGARRPAAARTDGGRALEPALFRLRSLGGRSEHSKSPSTRSRARASRRRTMQLRTRYVRRSRAC